MRKIWLGNNKKNLGVVVDQKLNLNQQRDTAVQSYMEL